MGWSDIFSIFNKFIPSRKARAIDKLKALTADYQRALEEGRDTDSAILKKEIDNLRQKYKITGGDI